MAKIPQGILGGIRGRVGNVVGAAWKGINYIRSMPLSVANPNTTAQQAQRGAFTQVVLTARLLLANLISTFWDPYAREMSGYNHFISVNIGAFATAGLTTPADFFAARGILTGVQDLALTSDASDSEHVFVWTDNSASGDALATDIAVFLVYNQNQDYWVFTYNPAITRDAGTATIAEAVMLEGDVMEGYVFFQRADNSKISDSSYIQETVVA